MSDGKTYGQKRAAWIDRLLIAVSTHTRFCSSKNWLATEWERQLIPTLIFGNRLLDHGMSSIGDDLGCGRFRWIWDQQGGLLWRDGDSSRSEGRIVLS